MKKFDLGFSVFNARAVKISGRWSVYWSKHSKYNVDYYLLIERRLVTLEGFSESIYADIEKNIYE